MDNNFKKNYFRNSGDLFSSIRKIVKMKNKTKDIKDKDKITPILAEKIMLAVTGVNNCVYCSYRHTKTALEQGIPSEEINSLLNGEFGNVSEEEQTALLYAQHWTESKGNPGDKIREKMIEYYGLAKTEHIEFYLNIINTGNLISNTVEAYKKEIRPVKGKINFFFTYLLCTPIAFFIRKDGKKHAYLIEGKVKYLK